MGDESERTRGALGGVGFAFLMGFVACVAIARDPAALLGPPLLFEDGRDVLAFFYDTRGPSSWFREWAGYVVLVPNLIGWFALAAPIEWSPWLLSLGSLGLATLALCFIARADYGDLEPVAVVRAGGVIVLALMPVLHHLFWFNSIYSVWSANLLLVLLTLAPAPADTQTRLVRGFAMALLIFSHALSLVLLPVFVGLAVAGERFGPGAGRAIPGARGFYAALACLVVVQQFVAVDHSAASPVAPLELIRQTSAFLLDRVVFGAVFGDRVIRVLHASGRAPWIAAGAILLLGFVAASLLAARARIDRRRGFALALLAWVIVATTAASVVGRGLDLDFLRSGRGARLFWVQRVCFLMLLLWSARLAWRTRWPSGAPRPLLAALIALAAVHLTWVNGQSNPFYVVSPHQGEQVRALTAELARQEALHGGRSGVAARLERKKWSVVIGP